MANRVQHTTGHQNEHGHAILSVSIACGILETVAVALRFVARRKLGARYRWDDWLILISLVPNWGMVIIGGVCEYGMALKVALLMPPLLVVADGKAGNHKDALNQAQLAIFLKVEQE